MSESSEYQVAIIGGGAAGLMAAATILEQDPARTIVLLERNGELGKKVKISGGGRCNVTTGIEDVKEVLSKYPRGGKFLMSAMHAFPPYSMMAWVESHGVPLKTEKDLRVFPESDRSEDVVSVFEKILHREHTDVRLFSSVIQVQRFENRFRLVLKDGNEIIANALVITTGGQAYRQTGSTGDGYAFAMSLGHTITDLAPSLSSFLCEESWTSHLAGVSFQYVRIKSGKAFVDGPFIFTHKGISGPAVFALSSQIAFEACSPEHPLAISIDLMPDTKSEELSNQIYALLHQQPKKEIKTVLAGLIPKSLIEIMLNELEIDESTKSAECSKKEVSSIVSWMKSIPLSMIGRGAGDEFVTAGGVSLEEVDPKTMESKIVSNLYFAGEVLNIDGYTGGFNLQASWATGHAAGMAIAESLRT